MAFNQPNFITAYLLGDGRKETIEGHLPDGLTLDPRAVKAESRTTMFGSTAGPWGGIGGAAMTNFQITTLRQGNLVLAFADDQPFGFYLGTDGALMADVSGFDKTVWQRFPRELRAATPGQMMN